MGFNTLKDVLQEQLEDLHSAETQLVEALPKMAQSAHHDELRQAFEHHYEETREHLKRVEEALGEVGVSNPTEVCKGMQGLIAEGEEMMGMQGDPFDGVKDLMDQTLDEESQADKLLTKIATGGMFKAGVNQQATA
jgi:ferritin-like metal-binding protein YciE